MKRGFCRSRHPNKHRSDNGEHSPEEQYQNSCSPVHLLQNKSKAERERENFECLVELERVFVFLELDQMVGGEDLFMFRAWLLHQLFYLIVCIYIDNSIYKLISLNKVRNWTMMWEFFKSVVREQVYQLCNW